MIVKSYRFYHLKPQLLKAILQTIEAIQQILDSFEKKKYHSVNKGKSQKSQSRILSKIRVRLGYICGGWVWKVAMILWDFLHPEKAPMLIVY